MLDVSSLPLEDLIARPRQPLPVADEEREVSAEDSAGVSAAEGEDELVDIAEVMDEEAEEQRLQQPLADGADALGPASKAEVMDEEAKAAASRSPSPPAPSCAFDDAALADDAASAAGAGQISQRISSAESSEGVGEAAAPGKRLSEAELQNAGVLWRSGRERRKPVAVYVPQEFTARCVSSSRVDECKLTPDALASRERERECLCL